MKKSRGTPIDVLSNRLLPLDTLPSDGLTPVPRCVIEIGACNAKFHRFEDGGIRTVKYPYGLGRDVYRTGLIADYTTQRLVDLVQTKLARCGTPDRTVAICTRAVRDALNGSDFTRILERNLGFNVRVLSARDEASLLAAGYLEQAGSVPAELLRVGGGGVEIVRLNGFAEVCARSLPFGAMRLHETCDSLSAALLEREFCVAGVVQADTVHACGGTARAIADTLGSPVLDVEELSELESQVRRAGPPQSLKPARAQVFLAGLRLINAFLRFARARQLHQLDISVGRVALLLLCSEASSRGHRWTRTERPNLRPAV